MSQMTRRFPSDHSQRRVPVRRTWGRSLILQLQMGAAPRIQRSGPEWEQVPSRDRTTWKRIHPRTYPHQAIPMDQPYIEHTSYVRVRYADTDKMGIVYYAKSFEYF